MRAGLGSSLRPDCGMYVSEAFARKVRSIVLTLALDQVIKTVNEGFGTVKVKDSGISVPVLQECMY